MKDMTNPTEEMWMKDPRLRSMSPDKLRLLQTYAKELQTVPENRKMSTFLSINGKKYKFYGGGKRTAFCSVDRRNDFRGQKQIEDHSVIYGKIPDSEDRRKIGQFLIENKTQTACFAVCVLSLVCKFLKGF